MRISDCSSDVCSSDLAEQYLSALWVRLPKNFQLLQSINEGFSVSGIQTSGRMVGYWPTDAFQRFDDDDILRMRPTEYGAITGTEELGTGFGSDGEFWVAESGPRSYVADIGKEGGGERGSRYM